MDNNNQQENIIVKKKSFLIWSFIAVMAVLVGSMVGVVIFARADNEKKVSKQLELARKYVSGLGYEQAIISYQTAISIDSKNVDALLELAEIYVEIGEYDKASELLNQVVNVVDGDQQSEAKKRADEIKGIIEESKNAGEGITLEKPSPELTPKPISEYVSNFSWQRDARTGDTILFGAYEQDNNMSNGKEPIEWIVLSNSGSEQYLLSKYAIDYRSYNEMHEKVTWATCSLRKWLNGSFFDEAFDESEKKIIKTTLVKNAGNPEAGTDGGNDTYDKVFLPSIADMVTTRYGFVSAYIDPNSDNMINRRCAPTKFAEAKGKYGNEYYITADGKQTCMWWLRSPGAGIYMAAIVDVGGCVDYMGYNSDLKDYSEPVWCGVRPALIICNPDSDFTPTFAEKPTAAPEPVAEPTLEITATSIPDLGIITLTEGDILIDEEHFPDINFRDYILDSADLDRDGVLSKAEAGVVSGISVSGRGIKSLVGVEYFYALATLYCKNNELTSLDVSQNALLQSLYCDGNKLSSLDTRYNTKLEILECNNNSLTNLDVSRNELLFALTCVENKLSSLDVRHNPILQSLWCDKNKLRALDVSHNPELVALSCQENQLTYLDVSNNKELALLQCGHNILTHLDVGQNAELTDLRCFFNNLTSLDVSHNKKLTDLHCQSNPLSAIDVSHNKALRGLTCYSNHLSILDVSHNPALEDLICDHNNLVVLDLTNNADLSYLECYANQLSSLDLSHNKALNYINCKANNLESLDVSKCDRNIKVLADAGVKIIRQTAGNYE